MPEVTETKKRAVWPYAIGILLVLIIGIGAGAYLSKVFTNGTPKQSPGVIAQTDISQPSGFLVDGISYRMGKNGPYYTLTVAGRLYFYFGQDIEGEGGKPERIFDRRLKNIKPGTHVAFNAYENSKGYWVISSFN